MSVSWWETGAMFTAELPPTEVRDQGEKSGRVESASFSVYYDKHFNNEVTITSSCYIVIHSIEKG